MAHLDDAMVALGGVVRHLDDGVDNVNQIISLVKDQVAGWSQFSQYSPPLLLAIEALTIVALLGAVALLAKKLWNTDKS